MRRGKERMRRSATSDELHPKQQEGEEERGREGGRAGGEVNQHCMSGHPLGSELHKRETTNS